MSIGTTLNYFNKKNMDKLLILSILFAHYLVCGLICCCAVKSMKTKARTEVINVWGEYKGHSNSYRYIPYPMAFFLELVLISITPHPTAQVQAIVFADSVHRYESGSNKVVPVCASSVRELTDFISDTSPARDRSKPAAYVDAFTAAFNSLNNNTDSGMW